MKIYLKSALFYSILVSNSLFAESWHENYHNKKLNLCQFENDSDTMMANLKLKYSQKTENKNEFLVGWNKTESHAYLHEKRPELGGEFAVVRCLPPGRYITIATGTVRKLNGNIVEGVVNALNENEVHLGKSTQERIEFRNLIWRPMVGDEILPIQKQISKVVSSLPEFKLQTNDLFLKESDNSFTYALSEEGQKYLKSKFEMIRNKRGRLLVQGFISSAGDREELRMESLMRAQTVATFLMREFSLNESQVISVGVGNDWRQPGMQPVGENESVQSESGVILKVI